MNQTGNTLPTLKEPEATVGLSLYGEQLLNSSLFNKGTAFSQEERDHFGLNGLLPYHIHSLEEQLEVAYSACSQRTSAFDKLVYLDALHDRNETLFYRLLHDHLQEMLPLIYTSSIGDASLQFSRIFRRPKGVFLSYPLRDRIDQLIDNLPQNEVDLIVITDGEKVHSLGDMGVGSIMMARAKLSLYTLFAGIHPGRTLPVVIDVGTNNAELLTDPHYTGVRAERVRGKEYIDFIDSAIRALGRKFPRAVVQWEDFSYENGSVLLDRYRQKICCFNDDIQSFPATVLAGILSACKTARCHLRDQRIVIYGQGTTAVAIAEKMLDKIVDSGLSREEAKEQIYLVDAGGLIHDQLKELPAAVAGFAQPLDKLSNWQFTVPYKISLKEVIQNARPTILIGNSGHTGAFTQEIVATMSRYSERPIIFPLSYPNRRAEAQPYDLVHWSEGRAIIAAGGHFAPVNFRARQHVISQCNNAYTFPGIALGALASKSTQISDYMLLRAAEVLSEFSSPHPLPGEPLFPALEDVRNVSREIALVTGMAAQEEGIAPKQSLEELNKRIDAITWTPSYSRYFRK